MLYFAACYMHLFSDTIVVVLPLFNIGVVMFLFETLQFKCNISSFLTKKHKSTLAVVNVEIALVAVLFWRNKNISSVSNVVISAS